jgi:hypothetical protein
MQNSGCDPVGIASVVLFRFPGRRRRLVLFILYAVEKIL